MANAGLFIGWENPVQGRERQALRVFNDNVQYYTRLQQEGKIESFEPVLLENHGGDLGGFVLLRGDKNQLARLRSDEEFQHNIVRASLVTDRLGVIGAALGDEFNRMMGEYRSQVDELI
jgi:hypothetical protein